MNCLKIGERIRKTRRVHDISREVLLEMADVSVARLSYNISIDCFVSAMSLTDKLKKYYATVLPIIQE